MHAIEIEPMTKTFEHAVAVDDVCLVVPRGSIYGFIGPNGSGKTTTLRMIMRILVPDRGDLKVLGSPDEQRDGRQDRVHGGCTHA